MTSWSDPLVVVGIAAVVVAALAIAREVRKDRLRVELERFEESLSPPSSPTDTKWSIRVRPSKTVEHCRVFVGDVSIPVSRKGPLPFETKISTGGAENFRIPTGVNPFGDDNGQTVVVRENKKTVKKQKFRTIPLTNP
jgi:hypothetical protein